MSGLISSGDVHGKSGDAFLAMDTAALVAQFAAGGKERTSAALEIARRKHNRVIKSAVKKSA